MTRWIPLSLRKPTQGLYRDEHPVNRDKLILAVAASGCSTSHRLPSHSLDDDSFRRLLRQAAQQRLIGILGSVVEAGTFAVTDEQLELLAESEQEWAVQAVLVERLLLEIADLLDEGGVPYRVLKGPALAWTAYPDPRLRVFADVDLLVPGPSFDQACSLLRNRLGAKRAIPELRPGFDREFGKEALLRVEGRQEIDLHRTFVTGPIGLTIPLYELFEQCSTFTLGGRELPTLTPVQTFVQTCINAAVGDFPPRACSLRDVVQLAPGVANDLDEVIATAVRWRVGLAVRRAVELAWTELQLDSMPITVDQIDYHATVVERLGMRSYLTPARSYTRPAASLLAIPGLRPRLRYVRAIVSPQSSYLESRGWDRRGHVRRALKQSKRLGSR